MASAKRATIGQSRTIGQSDNRTMGTRRRWKDVRGRLAACRPLPSRREALEPSTGETRVPIVRLSDCLIVLSPAPAFITRSMNSQKVAIVGASGYSGEELVRLLARH